MATFSTIALANFVSAGHSREIVSIVFQMPLGGPLYSSLPSHFKSEAGKKCSNTGQLAEVFQK